MTQQARDTSKKLIKMLTKDVVMRHVGKNRTIGEIEIDNVTCDDEEFVITTSHGVFVGKIVLIEI